eukprot:403331773
MLSDTVNQSLDEEVIEIGQRFRDKMNQIKKETHEKMDTVESIKSQFMETIYKNPGIVSVDKFLEGFKDNIDACQETISEKFTEYQKQVNEILDSFQDDQNNE